MLELPSTPWRPSKSWTDDEVPQHLPPGTERLNWRKAEGEARHTFTHFNLVAHLWMAETDRDLSTWGIPHDPATDAAIPTAVARMMALAKRS
jgi:hypothetical protein